MNNVLSKHTQKTIQLKNGQKIRTNFSPKKITEIVHYYLLLHSNVDTLGSLNKIPLLSHSTCGLGI